MALIDTPLSKVRFLFPVCRAYLPMPRAEVVATGGRSKIPHVSERNFEIPVAEAHFDFHHLPALCELMGALHLFILLSVLLPDMLVISIGSYTYFVQLRSWPTQTTVLPS